MMKNKLLIFLVAMACLMSYAFNIDLRLTLGIALGIQTIAGGLV